METPVVDNHPVLIFCPYLKLHRSHEFADFWIGPADQFEGSWDPPALKDAARMLLGRFVTVDGKPVDRPSLIASNNRLVDGAPPQHPDALELAVAFGALIQNPRHPADENDAWKVVTADNCDVWVQPVDLQQNRITLERGLRVRTLAGGYKFSDDGFRVPPPLELHWHGGGAFDPEVADAVYRVVSAPDSTKDPELAHRLKPAIRWWIKAWRNSASVSWEDRLVHLRIAVDALVGSDKTKTAIQWLNDLFSSVGEDSRGDLLWATDQGSYERTWGRPPRTDVVSAFDHWFWSFADTRNDIVHRGGAAALVYEQDNSPYVGMHVDVADRVVAEAILVSLQRCGFEHLWRTPLWRAIARSFGDSNSSNAPTYTAHATPHADGWHVAVDDIDGLAIRVAALEQAEPLLSPLISERVGVQVEPSQVYVIPTV